MLREMGPRLGKDRPGGLPRPRVFVMGYPGAGQTGKPEDLNATKSYSRWTVHFNTVAGNEALVLDAVTRYPNADFFGLNPGVVKSSIRANLFSDNALLAWIAEAVSSFMGIAPEEYATRIMPLLVSPDLEAHSGAMFDNKGRAVLPTPKLTDQTSRNQILSGSERLLTNAGVRFTV